MPEALRELEREIERQARIEWIVRQIDERALEVKPGQSEEGRENATAWIFARLGDGADPEVRRRQYSLFLRICPKSKNSFDEEAAQRYFLGR